MPWTDAEDATARRIRSMTSYSDRIVPSDTSTKSDASPGPMDTRPAHPTTRIDAVDVARGTALVAMIIYHFSWNLRWFGLVDWQVDRDAGWRLFAALIAASFLALVGVSVVLAHTDTVDWNAAWRRIARVAVAAAAISLVTWVVLDDLYVRFGILHAIALGSVIALLAVSISSGGLALIGGIALALPLIAQTSFAGDAWLAWTGLISDPPDAVDFVPVLPWVGVIFLAMAATRVAHARGFWAILARWRAQAAATRLLARAGRHSLAVYLVHQPILFGAVWAVVTLGLAPGSTQRAFIENCIASCEVASETDICRSTCNCTIDTLNADGTWAALLDDPDNADLNLKLEDSYRLCYGSALSGT